MLEPDEPHIIAGTPIACVLHRTLGCKHEGQAYMLCMDPEYIYIGDAYVVDTSNVLYLGNFN